MAKDQETATAKDGTVLDETFGDEPVVGEVVPVSFGGVQFPVTITDTPEAIQARILTRLFAAETLEDAFATWESQSSDALVGKRFEIQGVRWGTYNAQDGIIPLAEVHAVELDSGEETTFVTTAANITGFLALADSRGWFPFKMRIDGQKTRRDQTVLVPARA